MHPLPPRRLHHLRRCKRFALLPLPPGPAVCRRLACGAVVVRLQERAARACVRTWLCACAGVCIPQPATHNSDNIPAAQWPGPGSAAAVRPHRPAPIRRRWSRTPSVISDDLSPAIRVSESAGRLVRLTGDLDSQAAKPGPALARRANSGGAGCRRPLRTLSARRASGAGQAQTGSPAVGPPIRPRAGRLGPLDVLVNVPVRSCGLMHRLGRAGRKPSPPPPPPPGCARRRRFAGATWARLPV